MPPSSVWVRPGQSPPRWRELTQLPTFCTVLNRPLLLLLRPDMTSAATLPAEVLLAILECLSSPEDLLCAALVNRGWRAACVGPIAFWRHEWLSLKHNDTHRRRVLSKPEGEVDWFAESESTSRRFADMLLQLPFSVRRHGGLAGSLPASSTFPPTSESLAALMATQQLSRPFVPLFPTSPQTSGARKNLMSTCSP